MDDFYDDAQQVATREPPPHEWAGTDPVWPRYVVAEHGILSGHGYPPSIMRRDSTGVYREYIRHNQRGTSVEEVQRHCDYLNTTP